MLYFILSLYLAIPPEQAVLTIPRIDSSPNLEQFEAMSVPKQWQGKLAKISGFTQREPRDGEPATQPTEVYLGYDEKHLYVIFLAFDSEPDKVRAKLTGREKIDGDDTVNIQLDTFSDQRRGYTFICNPLGIQADALWTEGKGYDFSFNALWQSEGRLTDGGFIVKMAIPFKSLRFPEREEQEWGILLNRDMPRFSEDTFWPAYSMKVQGRLNQTGKLHGIQRVSEGRNFHLVPFAFARSFRSLESGEVPGFHEEDFDSDVGLDAKWVIQDRFVLDATVNPDFSQVESDEPQITANNRFEVFFPEKRPFFLENADLFSTPSQLVFTRRIIDPDWGLRLTGKAGAYGVGLMTLNDAAVGRGLPSGHPREGSKADIAIVRVNRDLWEQGSLGVLYTRREVGSDSNSVAAVDSRYLFNEHWELTAQAGYSFSRKASEPSERDNFANVIVSRSGKNFNGHYHYLRTGEEFRADLGYLGSNQRPGSENLHASSSYTFWKNKGGWLSWKPGLAMAYITDLNQRVIERYVLPNVRWDFVGKSYVRAEYLLKDELLTPREFNGLNQAKTLETETFEIEVASRILDWLEWEAGLEWGDAVNYAPLQGAEPHAAKTQRGFLGVSFKPGQVLKTDLDVLYSHLEDEHGGEELFTNWIYRLRTNWQATRRWSLRAILELQDIEADPERTSIRSRDNLNGDILITYQLNSWTALYIGFNHNERNRQLIDVDGRPVIFDPVERRHHDGHQAFMKFSYLIH